MHTALAMFDRLMNERPEFSWRSELLRARAEIETSDELASDILLSSDLVTEPVTCLASALLVIESHLSGSTDSYMDWALLYLSLSAATLGSEWSEAGRDVLSEVRRGRRSHEYGRMALIAEAVLAASEFRRETKGSDVSMVFDSYVVDSAIAQSLQPLSDLVSGLRAAQAALAAFGKSDYRSEWLVLPGDHFDPPVFVPPLLNENDHPELGQ